MRARQVTDSALQTLRQPRYARLFIVMAFVALACVGAGTWQILRFDDKVHDNDALTRNSAVAPAPVGDVLPVLGTGTPAPSRDRVEYRTVVATGTYRSSDQVLVRLRSVNGDQGFYVLTPLVTDRAALLLVRGFVIARSDGSAPLTIAAPPRGTVTVQARVQMAEPGSARPAGIPAGQISRINPAAQAKALGTPMFSDYGELLARQPGTAGLTAIPGPDLSNPAGGAVEPQHFAYIIQWYLFAALALAAPFAMARAERRERYDEDADHEPVPAPAVQLSAAERRAAKLADRYSR